MARNCFSCGYDLADIKSGGTCPECGRTAFDQGDVLDHRAVARRRAARIAGISVALFFVLGCGFCGLVLTQIDL